MCAVIVTHKITGLFGKLLQCHFVLKNLSNCVNACRNSFVNEVVKLFKNESSLLNNSIFCGVYLVGGRSALNMGVANMLDWKTTLTSVFCGAKCFTITFRAFVGLALNSITCRTFALCRLLEKVSQKLVEFTGTFLDLLLFNLSLFGNWLRFDEEEQPSVADELTLFTEKDPEAVPIHTPPSPLSRISMENRKELLNQSPPPTSSDECEEFHPLRRSQRRFRLPSKFRSPSGKKTRDIRDEERSESYIKTVKNSSTARRSEVPSWFSVSVVEQKPVLFLQHADQEEASEVVLLATTSFQPFQPRIKGRQASVLLEANATKLVATSTPEPRILTDKKEKSPMKLPHLNFASQEVLFAEEPFELSSSLVVQSSHDSAVSVLAEHCVFGVAQSEEAVVIAPAVKPAMEEPYSRPLPPATPFFESAMDDFEKEMKSPLTETPFHLPVEFNLQEDVRTRTTSISSVGSLNLRSAMEDLVSSRPRKSSPDHLHPSKPQSRLNSGSRRSSPEHRYRSGTISILTSRQSSPEHGRYSRKTSRQSPTVQTSRKTSRQSSPDCQRLSRTNPLETDGKGSPDDLKFLRRNSPARHRLQKSASMTSLSQSGHLFKRASDDLLLQTSRRVSRVSSRQNSPPGYDPTQNYTIQSFLRDVRPRSTVYSLPASRATSRQNSPERQPIWHLPRSSHRRRTTSGGPVRSSSRFSLHGPFTDRIPIQRSASFAQPPWRLLQGRLVDGFFREASKSNGPPVMVTLKDGRRLLLSEYEKNLVELYKSKRGL